CLCRCATPKRRTTRWCRRCPSKCNSTCRIRPTSIQQSTTKPTTRSNAPCHARRRANGWRTRIRRQRIRNCRLHSETMSEIDVDAIFNELDAALGQTIARGDRAPKSHDFALHLREIGVNSHIVAREVPRDNEQRSASTALTHLLLSAVPDAALFPAKSR